MKYAEFLFVEADAVMQVAQRESAIPFDVPTSSSDTTASAARSMPSSIGRGHVEPEHHA